MLAWGEYKAGLCPGCGLPTDEVWNVDGFHEVRDVAECDGCTARRVHEWEEEGGSESQRPKRVVYTRLVDTRTEAPPLPLHGEE